MKIELDPEEVRQAILDYVENRLSVNTDQIKTTGAFQAVIVIVETDDDGS